MHQKTEIPSIKGAASIFMFLRSRIWGAIAFVFIRIRHASHFVQLVLRAQKVCAYIFRAPSEG